VSPWWYPLQHWLGLDSASGPFYLAWSGFASDLGEVTLIGGLLAVYKRHNCHTRWCWRFGHHDFTDSETGIVWKLCRRCHPQHPGGHLTRHHLARVHDRNRGDISETQDR
jgi:hypothetical protein